MVLHVNSISVFEGLNIERLIEKNNDPASFLGFS